MMSLGQVTQCVPRVQSHVLIEMVRLVVNFVIDQNYDFSRDINVTPLRGNKDTI